MKAKLAFALGVLLLALVAGMYLSGYLTLLLLKLPEVPLTFGTYWRYIKAIDLPQVAPYVTRIKIAGAIGFGLPLLAWLFLAFAMRGPQQRATHGDARFASKGDLAATGMLKPVGNGIVVGKMGGDLIRLAGTRHVLLSAPTRSGKGVGAVIPNLLTFEDSIVVLDIKQEAFDLTSGWRQQYGPVYLFNPFAEDLRTDRWNPLSYVKRDPRFRITDLQAIAAILYEDDPHRDAFWTNQARNAFLAASLYLWESYDHAVKAANAEKPETAAKTTDADKPAPAVPTLGQVYRLFSGDGQTDLKTHLSTLAQQPRLQDRVRQPHRAGRADLYFGHRLIPGTAAYLPESHSGCGHQRQRFSAG